MRSRARRSSIGSPHKIEINIGAACRAPGLRLSGPFVFFAPRLIFVETIGDVLGDSWICRFSDRSAILLFDLPALRVHREVFGLERLVVVGHGVPLSLQLFPHRSCCITHFVDGLEEIALRHAQRFRSILHLLRIVHLDFAAVFPGTAASQGFGKLAHRSEVRPRTCRIIWRR